MTVVTQRVRPLTSCRGCRDYGILLVDSDEAINAFIREQYVSRQLGYVEGGTLL